MNRPSAAFTRWLCASDDAGGDWHAEPCHPVERVASNLRLGPLVGQSSGVETPAGDGFVSTHSGFGQASAIVARAALPIHAPMFRNRRKVSVALRCRGLARNGRRPQRDGDRSPGTTFGHSGANGRAITRAVCRQRRNVSLDLIEQLRCFRKRRRHRPASIPRRRSHACRHQRQGAACATGGATPRHASDPATRPSP